MRPSTTLTACVLAVLLAACSDQALIDRVAQLEASQDRLRASLTELGAPDPDELAARETLATEVATLSTQVTDLEAALLALGVRLDEQSLDVDGRLTAGELADADLDATLTQLRSDLTVLTDRVASLEAQLSSHRSDPSGHNG